MSVPFIPGLIGTGLRANRLRQEAEAEAKRQAAKDQQDAQLRALQMALLQTQVQKARSPAQPDYERVVNDQGEYVYVAPGAPPQSTGVRQPPRPETPRNIDRLTPEGRAARIALERALSGIPPRRAPTAASQIPNRQRWVADQATALMREKDPQSDFPKFQNFAEARVEAERRYDEVFGPKQGLRSTGTVGAGAIQQGNRTLGKFGGKPAPSGVEEAMTNLQTGGKPAAPDALLEQLDQDLEAQGVTDEAERDRKIVEWLTAHGYDPSR